MKLNKIINKLKSIFSNTKKHIKNHGFSYGMSFFYSSFFIGEGYKTKKKAIAILDNEFGEIFLKFSKKKYTVPIIGENQKNIFVFWAQGFDNLPFLQEKVLEKLKLFYSDYNLYLIDNNNFGKYVKFDKVILDRYKNGQITIQTFSDILRFNLLYKYGGVWCDATLIFFGKYEIFEKVQKYGFWSLNHTSLNKTKLWGKVYPVTYTTFFLATHKGNDIMGACVEFYNEYYKKYDLAIDYFMNDFMLILCMKYKIDNDLLNGIAFSKGNPFYLDDILKCNGKLNVEKCKEVPQKLNWRWVSKDKLSKIIKKIDLGDK